MKTTRPARSPRLRTRREGAGQIIPMLALMIVVTGGMVALAVDIGHVNQQRQQLQNTAVSAAEAGAYETYGIAVSNNPSFGLAQDHQVALVMTTVANNAGYSVANISGLGVYSAPPADPCQAGYTSSQVFLQAEYLDAHNTPIPNSSNPALVGAGAPPTVPRGIKVLGLGGCVPGFFSPIVGRKTFTVATTAQAGLVYSNISTPPPCGGGACPPTLTATPTATNTATATNTPTATATSSVPTATGTADTSREISGFAPFMIYGNPNNGVSLYAQGSPDRPAGDLVTIFGNPGWAPYQYPDSAAGLAGTATGVSVHDSSMKGCLDPSQTTFTIGQIGNYNHGGVGHCGTPPSVGDTVVIPLVDDVVKNTGDPCPANGGYCVQIEGFVDVYISVSSWPHEVQGFITGIVYDPYGIVEPPPAPTATNTPVVPTATMTPALPTATVTPPPPTATNTPLPPG